MFYFYFLPTTPFLHLEILKLMEPKLVTQGHCEAELRFKPRFALDLNVHNFSAHFIELIELEI